MDYSADACVNMFTANQKTRMLAACQTQRASFFATGNLALVPVAAPVVAFKASKSVICSGQTVTFTDMSGCVPNTYLPETNWPGITFAWTFTNGTVTLTSNLQNPTMTFTSPGSYNVTLTVTTTAGSNTLTQNNMVILGGTVTNACTPTSQAAGGYGQTVSNVKFNTINNTTSSMQNVAYQNFICDQNTIVTAGQVYSLSITGNAGPSGAERFEVYIDYNNDGIFANPGELVHSGSVPAGSQSALSTSTTSANVTIPATAVTNTLLRMRVIGNAGTITAGNRNCSSALFIGDVEDYGVYIATSGCTTAPTIGTQPAAATVCAGANNTFTVASTGASTYQWQVSTNGGSTWTNITNGGVYSNATTTALTITGATATLNSYRYRCITTNTCGSTNSTGVILTVNPSPSVSGTTPGNRCGTGTVVLGATASAGTLNWYAGATGGTSLGTGVSFTTPSISATTTYYVQATNSGCSSARTAVVATVNANPTITGTTPAGRCGTGTVVLGATASAGTPTWFANSTGGTSIGTGASFTTPSISATTTYYVQTTSPGGCSSARTAVVATVNSNPTITGTTPADRCGTGTVVLGATATAGTPTWFTGATGGSSIGTGTSFTTPSISTTTTYYVQATNSGCSSARTAVVATVNANPTITGTTPASRCGTGTLVLGATASVGTPTWFANATGGTSIGTGASFTTPSISATTTYYVQTTNPDGCTSARTAVVATIGSAPTVIATSPNNTLCNGSSAELNASGAGTYTWSPGGMTGASVTVSPTETTTYTVTGTTSGCEGTATILITVTSCLGIEDQTADELLVLYPNPAQGWMTIEGSTLMNYANIELRDATGRLVSSWKIDQAKMDIDLTGYASGNYMVKILGSEGQVIKKVQISK